MKIAIAGGTGFVGGHLTEYFATRGDEVIILTRSVPAASRRDVRYLTWEDKSALTTELQGLDALINLAGSSINQRWTPKGKERILQSRLTITSKLAELTATLKPKPAAVINASAIAIYGTSETDTYNEESPARITDFLADVVRQWERAADQIPAERLVKLRLGLVLGKDGGALGKMVLPYRLGAGGRIGSGEQWHSWIHIDDLVRLVDFCIRDTSMRGPVNAVGPEPVTNDTFGRTIGQVLHRPHWLPVPSFAMKAALGELSLLLLEGQRVLPAAALAHGFSFQHPTLKSALVDLLH
ncbi:hypothetical protein SY83_02530 [Paenibacillus swuensis]|uniref:Multidrug MFS transporter n=1 Tax=Paenibacillus swuensis TaxID=1178515 RepID=A0A172TEM7_9BACL|nr:TIGR01777 family oxidoreductase [Paenibacillus swuensis]ANE45386.1 hypothetical protein SY83_02530 [Paenibacillus swuensis]